MRLTHRFVARACVSDEPVAGARPQSISPITKGTLSMHTRYLKLTGAAIALSVIVTAAYTSNPVPDETIALANQANIDAQVAEATAQKERAAKAAAEFDASMATLRRESNRNSTGNQ